jgi:hypothetical protein
MYRNITKYAVKISLLLRVDYAKFPSLGMEFTGKD